MNEPSKLATALAKMQSALQAVSRDRENPFFQSKYATLSAIWDAIRGPLTSNGLSIIQSPSTEVDAQGRWAVVLTTTLLHDAGESRESVLRIPVTKADAQGIGSAITYARRYGLQAMTGVVADEDDDGNAASRPEEEAKQPRRQRDQAQESGSRSSPENVSAPTTFPNYGKAKGALISGASAQDLQFYLDGAKKELADLSKAKYHAKASALAAAIAAELARQRKATPEGQRETVAGPTPESKKPALVVEVREGETEEQAKQRTVYEQAMSMLKAAETTLRVDELLKRAKGKVTTMEFDALEVVARQRREFFARLAERVPGAEG